MMSVLVSIFFCMAIQVSKQNANGTSVKKERKSISTAYLLVLLMEIKAFHDLASKIHLQTKTDGKRGKQNVTLPWHY
uniref:Putative secreted protein n=1 Tax=Anopheles darlingi TaxID=43151 RepID=A0A2M4DHX3_ANODA